MGKNIFVITSNEPWGDIWYSKQNYAYELSKNSIVYFINPPIKWKVKKIIDYKFKVKAISGSLFVVDYENPLPVVNRAFNLFNNKLVSKRLNKFFSKRGIHDFIFWSFDPVRLYNPTLLNCSVSIWHVVDYYYFKYIGEKILCEQSDVIFSTSQAFLEEYAAFKTPKYIMPHGISSEEFSLKKSDVSSVDIPDTPYALYVGVIDHRIDYALLEKALIKFMDISFVFVGPLRLPNEKAAARIFKDKVYNNVQIVGPVHFKKLKFYVQGSLFCISFMDPGFHMNTVHHHKTLVYLAQGKPVFSYNFYEYKDLGELMYMSENQDDILEMMGGFLARGEEEELRLKRIEYSKKYTFENVLHDARKIIDEFKRK